MSEPRRLSARWRLALLMTAVASVSAAVMWGVALFFALRYIPRGDLQSAGSGDWAPGRDAIMETFLPRAVQAWVLVSVVAFFGAWWLAGRLLRPLDGLVATARAVAEGDLRRRVAPSGARDEFAEVGDAFDAMLDRIAADVRRQRRFIADASHELRTPLATTRAILDATDPSTQDAALVARLRTVNARAESAVDALLLLERLDNAPVIGARTDLSLAAEEAVESLLGAAEARDVELMLDARPAEAVADPGLMTRVAANLVQNAIVHNGGADRRIWVSTGSRLGGALLTVSNTGGELTTAEIATFTEPFRRGERTSAWAPGAGLGLALVASIVRVHGGTLTLAPRDGGGLHVEVTVPAPGS